MPTINSLLTSRAASVRRGAAAFVLSLLGCGTLSAEAAVRVVAAASPAFAPPGQIVVVSATAVDVWGSDQTALMRVEVDLTSIGGPAALRLWDLGNASQGDVIMGDAVFSEKITVGASVPGGLYVLPVTVTDSQGDTGTATISLMLGGPAAVDSDGDALPDQWELQMGLNPASSLGNDGAVGDVDGDGRTNAQEFADKSHPRGLFQQHFAEGAKSGFFRTWFPVFNPGPTPARVLITFMTANGTVVQHFVLVQGMRRETIDVAAIDGLGDGAFATEMESDTFVVADRNLRWDAYGRYGSHAETGIPAPSRTWFLAEGATHSGFDLFYLLQNPQPVDAAVDVTYLRPFPHPQIVKRYVVPAKSRFTVWVNAEDPQLAATDVSAKMTSDVPVVVERAMYVDTQGLTFGAGTASAGVTDPATRWYMAEGATGPFFDYFVLLLNAETTPANIEIDYLLPGGAVVTKPVVVPAESRVTVWVDNEDPRLANTATATVVRSTNGVPVVAERSLWWPTPWKEGHVSAASAATGTRWAIANGDGDIDSSFWFEPESYVLIANTSTFATDVKVTVGVEDGRIHEKLFTVPARARLDVAIDHEFTQPGIKYRSYWVLVESVGASPGELVVDWSHYSARVYSITVGHHSGAAADPWASGSSSLAVRVP